MATKERLVTIYFCHGEQEREWVTLPASERRELLLTKYVNGFYWKIDSPECWIEGDDERYALDCQACGVPNCFAE